MDWQSIARVLAPTLATGLLGPFGGVVAKVAADALFPDDPVAKEKATPKSIIEKIATMTAPEDVAKLKQAELDIKKFEAENQIKLSEVEQKSIQGAREARISALSSGNRTADYLSWLVIASFLAVAFMVLYGCWLLVNGGFDAQQVNAQYWIAVSGLIGSIMGYFSANAQQVIGFYFGSSAGSANKADQLAAATQDAFVALGKAAQNVPVSTTPTVTRTEGPGGTITTTASGETAAEDLLDNPRTPGVLAGNKLSRSITNAKWDTCVAYILEREGGFVNDIDDPGGATNMGITLRTLAAWRHADVTPDDVERLTPDEAKSIFRSNYWNVARCDALPPGVALSVFDAAVMSGPAQAVRFLQRAVGLQEQDVDGVVGPQTLGAVARASQDRVIEEIARQRELFYKNIAERRPASEKFIKGWMNRVSMTKARSLAMSKMWEV